MPDYEISCHRRDGTTVLQYSVQCSGDQHARLLAHSLKTGESRKLEIWRGENLIYAELQNTRIEQNRNAHQSAAGFSSVPCNFAR